MDFPGRQQTTLCVSACKHRPINPRDCYSDLTCVPLPVLRSKTAGVSVVSRRAKSTEDGQTSQGLLDFAYRSCAVGETQPGAKHPDETPLDTL
ncbi:hypothetical protein J6590_033142 [Homalodisca vitripennis]|nr:hypothetical protein J6590_033142 [Homalodisca vitripennis]